MDGCSRLSTRLRLALRRPSPGSSGPWAAAGAARPPGTQVLELVKHLQLFFKARCLSSNDQEKKISQEIPPGPRTSPPGRLSGAPGSALPNPPSARGRGQGLALRGNRHQGTERVCWTRRLMKSRRHCRGGHGDRPPHLTGARDTPLEEAGLPRPGPESSAQDPERGAAPTGHGRGGPSAPALDPRLPACQRRRRRPERPPCSPPLGRPREGVPKHERGPGAAGRDRGPRSCVRS